MVELPAADTRLSLVLEWLFKPKEHKGVIVGLDAVGKTTLLYRLKFGEVITSIPTIGANVETITHPGAPTLTLWDIGGRYSPSSQGTQQSAWTVKC